MKLLEFFRIFRPKSMIEDFRSRMHSQDAGKAQAENLAANLHYECPWCRRALAGHQYFHLTGIRFSELNDKSKLENLLKKLRDDDWVSCVEMFELAIDTDSIEVFLVSCPEGRVGWLVRKIPYEYLSSSEVLALEEMTSDGLRSLEQHSERIRLKWLPFRV